MDTLSKAGSLPIRMRGAGADAALMDGHPMLSRAFGVPARQGAGADAALMDGHANRRRVIPGMASGAGADAALMDGHMVDPWESLNLYGWRGGRRGPDGWTRADRDRQRVGVQGAGADAALMDGH